MRAKSLKQYAAQRKRELTKVKRKIPKIPYCKECKKARYQYTPTHWHWPRYVDSADWYMKEFCKLNNLVSS